jgi:hypothetical protein
MSTLQIYYDEGRTYGEARLFPYTPRSAEQSGYIDFKLYPERIQETLEDFRNYASTQAVQTFYSFLRWANGPDSHLETCDCAFRPPSPHNDTNSSLKLSAYGRLYLMFRNAQFNCSTPQTDWLCGNLSAVLRDTDAAMPGSEGVVAFTLNPTIHIALSKGYWLENGQFFCPSVDPGRGRHLQLTFWGYGNDESQAFGNLERVFKNIWASCKSVSNEIDLGLKRHQANQT